MVNTSSAPEPTPDEIAALLQVEHLLDALQEFRPLAALTRALVALARHQVRGVALGQEHEVGIEWTAMRRDTNDAFLLADEAFRRRAGEQGDPVSLAVSPRAFEQAFRSLRRGGTLVFVALPADNYMQLPIFETVLNGIHVVGSIVGTRLDLAEVFELHAAGKTQVIYETRKLEDVNPSFEEIEQGRIPARLVFDMQ